MKFGRKRFRKTRNHPENRNRVFPLSPAFHRELPHAADCMVLAVLMIGVCLNLWFQKNVRQEHRMQEILNSQKEALILQQRFNLEIPDYL